MNKVLLIDDRLTGHRLTYLESFLIHSSNSEFVVIVPERIEFSDKIKNKVKVYVVNFDRTKKSVVPLYFNRYLKWMSEIKRIVALEKPDVVHFLTGDTLYRYYGLGIRSIKKKAALILTFHQLRHSRLRNISYKTLAFNSHRIVVHTNKLLDDLKQLNIKNVNCIDYPKFNYLPEIDKEEALKRLGIDSDHARKNKVLLALGHTRVDKGADILCKALKNVSAPFYLIIAGKEHVFDRAFLEEETKTYADKKSLILKFLDEEEFNLCLNASDIIVLPYRKQFDGASGPLGEGVSLEKEIIGSNHASLGYLINTYHLGRTFETENVDDLSNVLTEELLKPKFIPDETYQIYRENLKPEVFIDKYQKLYQDSIKNTCSNQKNDNSVN